MRLADVAKASQRSSECDLKLEHVLHQPSAFMPEGPAAPRVLIAALRTKLGGLQSVHRKGLSGPMLHPSGQRQEGALRKASASSTVAEDPGLDGDFKSSTLLLKLSDSNLSSRRIAELNLSEKTSSADVRWNDSAVKPLRLRSVDVKRAWMVRPSRISSSIRPAFHSNWAVIVFPSIGHGL